MHIYRSKGIWVEHVGNKNGKWKNYILKIYFKLFEISLSKCMTYHCKQHANTVNPGNIKRVNIYWKLWEDYVTKKLWVTTYSIPFISCLKMVDICSKLKNLLAKTKLITSINQYFTYILTIREVF